MKNATRLWGIPLHPRGEMDIVDFTMGKPDDIELMQARAAGAQFHIVYLIVVGYVFASNLYTTIKMVISRSRALDG